MDIDNGNGYVKYNDIIGNYKIDNDDIMFWLEIPKIGFRDYVYDINSINNNVDYHIELLDDDIYNNFFVIAGHSGNGSNAYFNDLVYLEEGDFIKIVINNKEFLYIVSEIYYKNKDGKLGIDDTINSVYLITCSRIYNNIQLIIKGNLI